MVEKKQKPASPGLWKKIHAVQTEATYVSKDTTAQMGSSTKKVASIEAVLDVYLPLCQKHGLTIVPVKIDILNKEYRPNAYNKPEFHILAMCFYRVVDIDTGDYHEFGIPSYGQDAQDKATGKLLTYGLKYAYGQLFSSRKGDDPDASAPDDKGSKQPDRQPERQADKPKPQPEKQPEKKQEASDDDAGARETYQELVLEIKEAFPIDHESRKVPKWAAEFKPATDKIAAKGIDSTMKSALVDFALFHWHCINVIQNPDIDVAAKTFEKAKSKFAPANVKFIENAIAKRRSAK